jgi:restriction endonuclease S subunit
VRFLDEKTAQIDAAMDKKRRLIDLLNEQKAILINHAVTKGLNPKAPMKDSGVDWIGEIPAHWDVKKFKFLIDRLVGGSTPSMDNQRYWNGHIPWASPKDMRSAVIYDTQLKITDAGRWANGLELVPSNSMIFVARSGVLKNRIPVALTGNDLTLNQDMKAVVPKTLTSEFLISLFNGLQSILLQQVTKIGATVDSVEIPDLMNLPIAYPPRKEEQEMIVRRASELSSSVGTTIACVEREIATLNEFKQTLIANAVTGKIKI